MNKQPKAIKDLKSVASIALTPAEYEDL